MGSRRHLALTLVLLLMASRAYAENVRITRGPVVEHTSESTATVAWSTNVSASTVVSYGTDPNVLDKQAQTPWGSLTHRVVLKNLKPGTTYYFRVTSGQAEGSGTTVDSQIGTFATKAGNAARGAGIP